MTPSDRRWLRLARRVLPEEDRDWLVEELEALHRDRIRRWGRPRAARALRGEVLRFAALRVGRPIMRHTKRGGDGMRDLWQEIRLSIRSMRRTPGFAWVAVASLALGIGANALVFAVVDGVVLRPLPYPEPDRIVSVWENATLPQAEVAYARENATTLESVGAWLSGVGANLQTEAGPVRLTGIQALPSLLEIMGSPLAMGPGFSKDAGVGGTAGEVILSHRLWTTRFGADPGILGTRVELDDEPRTVVGVLRPGESFPSAGQDFILPLALDDSQLGPFWGYFNLQTVARLAPGATPEAATRELREFAGGPLIENNPIWTPASNYRAESRVVRLSESLAGPVRDRLYLLLGAVIVVLLVVSANVGNLMLNRGISREGEMAVRAALGAGRARIAGQHLLEGLLLAAAGGLAGLLLAVAGLRVLEPLLAEVLPRSGELAIDLRVAGITAAVALAAGLGSSAVVVFRGRRHSPASLLRASAGGTGTSEGRRRLARGLVVAQVAASVVLLVSSALLIRSLGALRSIDPGFEPEGILTAQVDFSPARYPSVGDRATLMATLDRALSETPQLSRAALAGSLPFGGGAENGVLWLEGITDDPNILPGFRGFRVTPGYFEAMGIELVRGRLFLPSDDSSGEPVALVDETAAREEWGNADPVGRMVRQFGPTGPQARVVGVVRPIRGDPITAEPMNTWYRPLSQAMAGTSVRVVLDPTADLDGAFDALRQVVAGIDPTAAVSRVAPYPELIARGWRDTRFLMAVLSFFALVTLVLGALGVYGVSAYMVRRRSREFGVRIALGADPSNIRSSVLADGGRLALVGGLLGLAAAVPLSRLVQGFLVGVAPLDPVAFALVPLVLACTTLGAVYLPALRATRVDPATVLREE